MPVDPTAYGKLDVPCELIVRAISVIDFDNRYRGGTNGWVWEFESQGNPNPDHNGLTFKVWTSHSARARWKLEETLEALGQPEITDQTLVHPPTNLINTQAIATIDYPSEYYQAQREGREYDQTLYRNIIKLAPYHR